MPHRKFDAAAYRNGTPDTFDYFTDQYAASLLTSELLGIVLIPTRLQVCVVENDDVEMPRDVFHKRCEVVLAAVFTEIDKRVPMRAM